MKKLKSTVYFCTKSAHHVIFLCLHHTDEQSTLLLLLVHEVKSTAGLQTHFFFSLTCYKRAKLCVAHDACTAEDMSVCLSAVCPLRQQTDTYRCDVSLMLASSGGWLQTAEPAADIKLTVSVDSAAFKGAVSVRADGGESRRFVQARKFQGHLLIMFFCPSELFCSSRQRRVAFKTIPDRRARLWPTKNKLNNKICIFKHSAHVSNISDGYIKKKHIDLMNPIMMKLHVQRI